MLNVTFKIMYNTQMKYIIIRCLFAGIAFQSVAGCASQRAGDAGIKERAPLIWPAPPAEPRIEHVQTIYGPRDFGVKLSLFYKVINFLAGSDIGVHAFSRPFDVAFDERDNVCFTDTGNGSVCYYNVKSRKYRRWTKVGRHRFIMPVSVAKRGAVIYVADSEAGKVIAFLADGKPLFEIADGLEHPVGVLATDSNLYVADTKNHCLMVYNLHGRFERKIGTRGIGPGEYNYPTFLASGPEDAIMVTDTMNYRIQLLGQGEKAHTIIGSQGGGPGRFSRPKGVASDSLGHIYVVDALFDNIQVFNEKGQFLMSWGEAGQSRGEFWLPSGLSIDNENRIFVADSYNKRIQVFKYIGQDYEKDQKKNDAR